MRTLSVLACLFLIGCTSDKAIEEETYTETVHKTLTASDLYDAYKSNQVAADNEYNDKLVIVTGEVDTIGKDIGQTLYITLKTGEYDSGVQCFFAESHNSALASLSKGDSVTVRGKVSSFMFHVIMRGCMLE